HLVEVLLPGVGQAGQSEDRGQEQEEERDPQVAAHRAFFRAALIRSSAYPMGTPNEFPPNLESTAYSTPTTRPSLFSTGPPLPPWVVGASKTMSLFVTSPMWPWVVEGRMSPRRARTSVMRSEDLPAATSTSF